MATTDENLPKSTETPSARNSIDRFSFFRELSIGFFGNILWEIFICLSTPFVRIWNDILPPIWVFILIGVFSLIISFLLRLYFSRLEEYHSYAHYLRHVMIVFAIVLGLSAFVTGCQVVYDLSLHNDIKNQLKWLVGLSVALSVTIGNTMYVSHMYRNIRRNKQQLDIRQENEKSFDKVETSISQQIDDIRNRFELAFKKADLDSAITGTIIPFKYDMEKKEIKTYLLDNTKQDKQYSWKFAGGHVKFSDDDSPDSIAIERAKTELGLNVKILTNGVIQDELIDNMQPIKRPHYVYKFTLGPEAKCFLEQGHEYHIDLVYVGEIEGISDDSILRNCLEVILPAKSKLKKEEVSACCNKSKSLYYQRKRVKQKDRKDIDEYIINMLYAAYCDYYDEKNQS